jgi:RimJ/RimL family protein N-acetyltransferase
LGDQKINKFYPSAPAHRSSSVFSSFSIGGFGFEQERDPIANRMAAYPAKDEASFMSLWKNKIRGEDRALMQTILCNECVAGSIECWEKDGKWLVGYWIGREYWGKGIATAALRKFLGHVKKRPLHAYVSNHNKASFRVLEKCRFTVLGRGTFFSEVHGHEIEETVFVCN